MNTSYEANGQAVTPEQFYALACDPQRSVAVEACAGAGKTWMLVSRMLRALLEQAASARGVQPQEILAITFTKKAAGEMRERLYQWLGDFAQASSVQLEQELLLRGIDADAWNKKAPQGTPDVRELLSNLYQTLLSNGRQVQIRTFHSWFAALLRNAPLAVLQALQLPSRYELLEDDARALPLLWPRFYSALQQDAQALASYQALVAAQGRSQAGKALEAVFFKRTEFLLADEAGVVDASVPHFSALYTEFAGLDAPLEMLSTNRDHRQKLRDAAVALGAASAPTFSAKGGELEQACTAQDWPAAMAALFTQDGKPRKFGEKMVGIERVRVAQDLLQRVQDAQAQHAAWQHQQCLLRLGRVLLAAYAALKREHGWVDMADLERAALHLLADAELGAWVQQRLDAQVKHLLIDEFQDTNPLQWRALSSWLGSYAGAGGGERPGVFIVGDPKQSIYRFRRAEPQVFKAAQLFVAEALGGTRLACDHTRRNAPAVLAAVNAAMAQAQREGLLAFRAHSSSSTLPGSVLRLPQIARPPSRFESRNHPGSAARSENGSKISSIQARWRDTLTEPRESFEDSLRSLEARQAARWIAQQIAQGAQPADFMVLSRKRASLGLLHSELRDLHISAAVAEKTGLMDCCEVQDVVALLDALVSPGHSLSLARALKSPLFGLSDEDLVCIALAVRSAEPGGENGAEPAAAASSRRAKPLSWFDVLQKTELLPQHLRGLHGILLQYQSWVRSLPPHDALGFILHHARADAQFAAAVPAAQRASVWANLGALLQATLALQGARFSTAYGLVRQLKAGSVQAPAQVPSAAVQLLTVHGAKGLEARTVLLLDTDAQATRGENMGVLVDWPGEAARPAAFVFVASEAQPAPSVRALLASEQQARQREEINALYVAMTRAQQRLVLSSNAPHAPDAQSWWQRLGGLAEAVEVPHEEPHEELHEEPCAVSAASPEEMSAPSQSASTATHFEMLFLPENQAQSRIESAQAATKNVANEVPLEAAADSAARVGQAMHRLLEWQATGAASAGFVASGAQQAAVEREFALSADELARALALAQRIREGQAAWVWDAAQLVWQGNELELAYQGQLLRIDRLVQRADTQAWWVLDYKSAQQPEQQAGLNAQMQRYRTAVQVLYAGAKVEAAWLGGDGSLRLLGP